MSRIGKRTNWETRFKRWRAELRRRKARGARQAASVQITIGKTMDGIQQDLKKADRQLRTSRKNADRSIRRLRRELDRNNRRFRRSWRTLSR